MINRQVLSAVAREYQFLNRRESIEKAIKNAPKDFRKVWERKLKELLLSREKATK
jgi:hypothetical protein